ncbi:farnesyl-diphosphate farnesyltransferase [Halovenus aranensis]|uniref:Farnesyl-diphosphate farnesyltransferase n=1 Tax=Halovenus aranensis TaxID=890420 RepID=A0A1G8SQV5_9EURY|nr:phytoene/squalene synthase family protein [Halovenus aranensis]SDJ30990.1 farnesyl-diphosphate farnesyltransferase [Halovenus aranensis]
MTDHASTPADPDFDWCYEIVGDVSRTFALTITELDEPLAREICVGYLLCRVADTVEDSDAIPPAEQVRLLDQYRTAFETGDADSLDRFMEGVERWKPDTPSADWRVVAETPRLLQTFAALPESSQAEIAPAVTEMIDGMGLFIERYATEGGLRIQTLEELEEYCWYVAGTVGHLVTGLVARDAPERTRERLYDVAPSFGLLLQLVNVAKDVAADYEEENNVYVPDELLERHGLHPDDMADHGQHEAFVPVVEALVTRAEGYTEDARTWLETMPDSRGNVLGAWAIPYLLAVATMRELRARPEDVMLEGDVKVSRSEVHALVETFAGEEVPSLEALQAEIEQSAFGR